MNTIERVSRNKCFGGYQDVYRHSSSTVNCDMNFAVFLPPQTETQKCPLVYWLSGLTCTEQNFIIKSNAHQFAAELGLIIVAPDTSPRGEGVADDENYDLGQGAGFYVNATEQPWARHYQMYDYVTQELPPIIDEHFPVNSKASIMGHSMGGHGALTIALKNPGRFQAISAFAPIVAPIQCPWGQKAFTAYLGNDQSTWQQYDSTQLIANAKERLPILIDQGDADEFLKEQLKPKLFQQACEQTGHPLTLRMQPGYDHSFYFINTFLAEHLAYHARALGVTQ